MTHPVAVWTSPSPFRIGMDTNVVYILSSVCLLPQLSYNFIYFFHFHTVEAHKCPGNIRTDQNENIITVHSELPTESIDLKTKYIVLQLEKREEREINVDTS